MKYCFYCLFFVSILSIFSCTNNHQNTTAATLPSKQKLDTADARLANDLSMFCTTQVQAAQLVQTKTTAQKVKGLAKQNEQLYTTMGNYLNNVSVGYNIKLPSALSPEAEKNFTDLKVIKTASLDHAYLLQMLKDHNRIIRKTNAAKNIQCVPLKMFVVSNQAAIIKQAYALADLKDETP